MKAIPSESNKERVTTMNLKTELKNLNRGQLKSAVIGMVIADGCLSKKTKNDKNNAYFQMTHCEKQYDYLMWKKIILDQISYCKIHPQINYSGYKPSSKGYHLGSKTNPLFTKLYYRFYHAGHKSVDEYLVKKIDPLALAIIYMDDGTLGKAQPKHWTKETFYLKLCNFDYANLFLIKKSLKILYDLDWNINIHSRHKDTGRTYYQLRLLNKHNDKFVDIIRPYVETVPTMMYKLGSYANLPKWVVI